MFEIFVGLQQTASDECLSYQLFVSKTQRKAYFNLTFKARSFKVQSCFAQKSSMSYQNTFFNRPFDKGRLKVLISWAISVFGEKKTV